MYYNNYQSVPIISSLIVAKGIYNLTLFFSTKLLLINKK